MTFALCAEAGNYKSHNQAIMVPVVRPRCTTLCLLITLIRGIRTNGFRWSRASSHYILLTWQPSIIP